MPSEPDQIQAQWELFLRETSIEVLVIKPRYIRASEICVLSPAEADRLPTKQYLLFGMRYRHVESTVLTTLIDEKVAVQIVLRSRQTRESVQEWLPRLDLTVTAHATNAVADGTTNVNPATTKHDIATEKLHGADQDAIHVFGPTCNVVWSSVLHISRPRARLQRPTIYFTTTVSLSKHIAEQIKASRPEYMRSYEPSAANVLEALQFTPELSSSNLYLSDQCIKKVAPVIQHDHSLKVLRGTSKRAFPAMPVLFPRLQSTPLPDCTMTALHIEASQLLAGSLVLQSIQLSLDGMTIERLGEPRQQSMQPGDELTILYKIRSGSTSQHHGSRGQAQVSVQAVVASEPDQEVELNISWQLPIDHESSDSIDYHTWCKIGQDHKIKTDRAVDKQEPVLFNFTAPSKVNAGTLFRLQVQCINHSKRTRNFTILPQPDATTLLVHSPVVKLRGVAAGACYEADISYTAAQQGLLDFGRIEVVDVDSQSACYVEELPDVVATQTGD